MRIDIRVTVPVTGMDGVQRTIGGQVVAVVEQVVGCRLIGAVQQGLAKFEIVERWLSEVHHHGKPGAGLIAFDEPETLFVPVIVDIGGGKVHRDVGVPRPDHVAEHGPLTNEPDRDPVQTRGAGRVADGVPPAVVLPFLESYMIVGDPLL